MECRIVAVIGAHGVFYRVWSGRSQLTTLVISELKLFLIDTYEKIKNDTKKRLQATEKKGVSSAMHYKSLAPSNFVPPLLHMEIGMVNQAWENFVNWVDDVVEKIPEDEKVARTAVVDATDNLKERMREKKEAKKTISIEVMEKNAKVKLLKGELKRAKENQVVTGTIQARLALLESFVKEQKVLDKTVKEK